MLFQCLVDSILHGNRPFRYEKDLHQCVKAVCHILVPEVAGMITYCYYDKINMNVTSTFIIYVFHFFYEYLRMHNDASFLNSVTFRQTNWLSCCLSM